MLIGHARSLPPAETDALVRALGAGDVQRRWLGLKVVGSRSGWEWDALDDPSRPFEASPRNWSGAATLTSAPWSFPAYATTTTLSRYVPTPNALLSSRIHALVDASDPRVSVDDAQWWSSVTTGTFELDVFAGGHFYFGTNLDDVTATINADLVSRSANS